MLHVDDYIILDDYNDNISISPKKSKSINKNDNDELPIWEPCDSPPHLCLNLSNFDKSLSTKKFLEELSGSTSSTLKEIREVNLHSDKVLPPRLTHQ